MKKKSIVFISNYMNHHQLKICDELYHNENIKFTFIATKEITRESLSIGYIDYEKARDYILCSYSSRDSEKRAMELCNSADLLIVGSCDVKFYISRVKANKYTLLYQERLFKKRKLHRKLLTYARMRTRFRSKKIKNTFVLCASGFTSLDFSIMGLFKNKCFKWGYFPDHESSDGLPITKTINTDSLHIMWVARFISFKRPEKMILIAEHLRKTNRKFKITMLGNGVLLEKIRQEIQKRGLSDFFYLPGSVKSYEVAQYMNQADIFVFTSNQQEGWGAVLGEAMSQKCVPVAFAKIGSVPFLLKDGYNGLTYNDDRELLDKIDYLFDNRKMLPTLATNAYETIVKEWNYKQASRKLVILIDRILNSEEQLFFEDGVLSKAEIIK